ncbi:MAG: FtsQ-type POTRA domain-containing protein [Tissierellia bacterium]|nr:FtsQ-type POTRA domain-containing protein [Bacillota bacterium]NLL23740.1 FtsQ-type POTRA domain-containing protein [Tissierellia bacterium]
MKKIVLLLTVVFLGIAVYVLFFSGLFDIRAIRFNLDWVPEEEVLEKIGVEKGDNLILLSPRDIRNNLAGDARFEAVSMKKNWPDELLLHISYRTPVARIVMNEKSVYVDAQALIVYIGEEIYDAITIEGMELEGAVAGRTVEAGEGSRFRRALDLAELVDQSDMGMKSIRFDEEELILTISDGFVALFGKGEDLESAFSIFYAVYQDLMKEGIEEGAIDLRNPDRYVFIPLHPEEQP